VTPSNVSFNPSLGCGNFGVQSVGVDPQHPSSVYAEFNCQGIWRSTDYGANWSGPINTGNNGPAAGNCAGGIAVADGGPGNPPILYEACIRGSTGFWVSTNGGTDWTSYPIAPLPKDRQDVYPPSIDPHNPLHLVMTGHEQNYIVESMDGGHTWTNVPMNSGMLQSGGTGFAFFVDTGDPGTTAKTWLWLAQGTGGKIGTWRTEDGGANWTNVAKGEHIHGASQMYNAGGGVVYMAGIYADGGWGVIRSADYGKTWTHVGENESETCVWGTPTHVYAGLGAVGVKSMGFEMAPQPATAGWTKPSTPSVSEGPAQVATTYDGKHHVFVGAMWFAGLWTYVEP
jgi:hypothetical protein